MSISLTLAFDRYNFSGPILCFERHNLDWQDYELFDRITAEAVPLVEGVQWYEDEGLELHNKDRYGTPLTYMPAHTIARHLAAVTLRGFDAATLAYLNALPPATRVVLWWS